ncbi:dipeptide ABC transporter ATP-binding protein [Rhizobium sp. EC-SD404]|uniref:ABC transporter ATP-binding protein n=1 Tax=Rhizobium sp. EC-SD404 TaxID=2038389 RepID=UPI0012529714|nr:dipeptide ABC transporter ATP-binding protein [Rhizobium sp. EC-SD404]VVS98388.1 oligopeptide transporter subunit; ATP-binding component of ABC superfamily [Rhizobium sp. EC-SD404]
MSGDAIIETRDLVRHFKTGGGFLRQTSTIHAVDGVSIAVRRGETFAIVGESGCGKSTLARLLLRLIEPTAGTVTYEGRDLTTATPAELRALRGDIQFIFQDPFSSLNPRMTVGALVGEPLQVHGHLSAAERKAKVESLLSRVGLRPEHAGRYPHEFSGGQRQRIGIARALASGPKLLIGDEPVSALDVSVQAQIVNLLEDLKAEFGLTLIIIAHDLAVIRHMSDRLAVMYLGQVVELADTEALFARPLHPYTQALLAAIPAPVPGLATTRAPLFGDIPSPANPPQGCRFHTRCPHATPVCSQTQPPLESVDDKRSVACHHWREIAGSTPLAETQSSRTQAAERRFAIYRSHRLKEASKPPTAP